MPFNSYPASTRVVELTTYELTPRLKKSCPACSKSVEVHQPDAANPDRLIVICPSCDAWYLANLATGIMTRLPE